MSGYWPANVEPVGTKRRRGRARDAVAALRLELGHYLVLGSLATIISIRFFTEEVHVVPAAANFIDIPLLLLVGGAAVIERNSRTEALEQSSVFALSVLFLLLTTISAI